MEQDCSIDKLILTLKNFENKEQTLEEALDNIYQNNLNQALNNTNQFIKAEIEKTKKFVSEMKVNLNKKENSEVNTN